MAERELILIDIWSVIWRDFFVRDCGIYFIHTPAKMVQSDCDDIIFL